MSTTFTTGADNSSNQNIKLTSKSGNVASLKDDFDLGDAAASGLKAIDTHGNVFEVPDFTIKEILQAIPKDCYERRLTTSFYYVFRDIALIATTMYLGATYIPMIQNPILNALAWFSYVFVQGLFGTGIWVLAHECGHQAFSDYGWVNDLVGWILHSYLLVPYFSWKYSHGKHHKATGHLTRDTVFVPATKETFMKNRLAERIEDITEDAPLATLYSLFIQQIGGWWAYLTTNVTGQPYADKPQWMKNHFVPSSPLFEKREYWFIVLSDLGILIQGFILYNWFKKFGAFNFFIHYFFPYMWVNHWLVFITFLQHTAPTMPHYDANVWNFARGAAATIDREMPFVGPHIFHDIIETHVLHHYVSRIPFYNARKASAAIKKVMGKHYQHTDENMWVSLWRSGRECQFVDGDNGVRMFRNTNNIGVKPTSS
ncbi:hypothetical protein WICPIJ_000379 [Wickerhamomyces pijperi]|uniref:Fatty acid desaturase domain-containing protein n=1 Tax=Wickerhamomyces pijperi TaxID=599730 RepID=A0A9P8QGX1_WICPI|nr:hypothetical protein WICPIJ_000379 [Wickerhamomyces pijperi]